MKKSWWTTVALGVAAVFVSAALYAGTTAPEMMKLNSDPKVEHEKGVVDFSHKKHVDEYKATCGSCHHDKDHKPLNNLKAGDNVQKCSECHKKPGLKPKGKDAPKLTEKETMEYAGEAFHKNCIDCHKQANTKSGNQNAPTTCVKCHQKKA